MRRLSYTFYCIWSFSFIYIFFFLLEDIILMLKCISRSYDEILHQINGHLSTYILVYIYRDTTPFLLHILPPVSSLLLLTPMCHLSFFYILLSSLFDSGFIFFFSSFSFFFISLYTYTHSYWCWRHSFAALLNIFKLMNASYLFISLTLTSFMII